MDHTVSLATADRSRALIFYRDGLGLEAFGPLADDGIPEPLQLRLASSVSLMLIPTGGFGWIAGEDRVAPPRCQRMRPLDLRGDEAAVRARYEAAVRRRRNHRLRAVAAGVERIRSPDRRPRRAPLMILVRPRRLEHLTPTRHEFDRAHTIALGDVRWFPIIGLSSPKVVVSAQQTDNITEPTRHVIHTGLSTTDRQRPRRCSRMV